MKRVWKKTLLKGAILAFWLLVWEIAAVCIAKPVVLVGPWTVLQTLWHLAGTSAFWRSVVGSVGRICLGFTLAFLAGVCLGGVSYKLSWVRALFAPVVAVMKAIPVASFVILILIWTGSRGLACAIAFLVAFPAIYLHTIAGLSGADRQLLEMAQVFRLGFFRRLWYIYRPPLLLQLANACRVALGMSWKAGIAAEVIGTPTHSIGENLYLAKVFFSTGELLAWTLVVIVLSSVLEKCVMLLLRWLGRDGV